MNSQLQVDNAEVLSSCMIRDRYRIGKALSGRASRGSSKKQIERSQATARARAERLPRPSYPENLPVSGRVEDIKNAISRHQVVIVAGETGSGKTTQLPKICLELQRGVYGLIGHTQPRRVAARTVASRISDELGTEFGREVGYQVRFTDQTSPDTLVKVMTDGILLAETQQNRFLEQYDTLIIDEAHERSLNIDFLLGYLKRILPRRRDLKVIITSATIDVERFSRHFSNAPVIEVSGRTYPVEVIYRPPETPASETGRPEVARDADQQMYGAVLDTLHEIDLLERRRQTSGDVLVFLAGEREIRELAQLIRKSDLKRFEVLPLYSRLSVKEQNRVFAAHQNSRIVLSTNVAETSLTVPGIRYVVDPGLARISRYSVRSKVQQLPIEPISRASADQRKGRCGRVSEGVCYRLYSEADFNARPEFTAPEILRTNLASVILQMLNLRLGAIEKFPFLERPEQRQINDGYQLLTELLAVDPQKRLTREGKAMARLPIDLRLAKMVLEAGRHGCLGEVLTIVSALAVQDPRERPHDHQQAADEKHRSFWDQDSDFVAFLKLWETLENQRQALTNSQFRKYCRENYISYLRYLEWRDNHRQLRLMCRELKLRENQHAADYQSIHVALLSGLLGNIGEKTSENEYQGTRNRRHYIFPGSSQFKRKPKWIVSAELVETTRLFGRLVARIDSDWIEPLARHLVKHTYHEPHFDQRLGQVCAFEDVMLYGLTIVKRRRVDFSGVDPAKARHLFIQTALVERELDSDARFFRHNGELLDQVEQLESKSRKRDILADSYTIYRFYDERLPENIFSAFELDNWRKVEEARKPKLLYMTRDQLMKQDTDLPQNLYPDQIEVGGNVLSLDYHFDPQHVNDGVSINIPLSVLRQVPEQQIDWVIPGLLEEKCLALIKSLPKAKRKNFVPAPDYAARVASALTYDGRSLVETLAEKLFRLSGTQVDPGDFDPGNIDQYLRMNIKVLDDEGRVLASGRKLDDLVGQFTDQIEAQVASVEHNIEQSGLTDWTFGDLPPLIAYSHSGVQIKGYPALVDQGESVSLEVQDNPVTATATTDRGVLRLIRLRLRDQAKYVAKNIPGFAQFSLYYATRGTQAELRDDLVNAVFRYTFIEDRPPVRTREAFEERLAERQELMIITEKLAGVTADILKRAMDIEGRLKSGVAQKYPEACEDIRSQLQGLVGDRFLDSVPFEWLKQYPRYLKAIDARLEKLPGQLEKDRQETRLIAEYWSRLGGQLNAPGLERYRWMIEEFRVSLFAQSLGTRVPVSAKRLDKEWQKSR